VSAACFLSLAIWWSWVPGLVILGISALVLTHALYRRRHPGRSAAGSLCLDATAIAVAVVIIEPPLVVVLAPLSYMVAMASLLLSGSVAISVIAYSLGAASAAVWMVNHGGAPEWSTIEVGILTLVSLGIVFPHVVRMLQAAARATARGLELEDRLTEREERYRSLLDGVPVGVYRTSATGEVMDANLALVEMLGFPDRETLLDEGLHDVYWDSADRDRWMATLKERGVVRDYEIRLRCRDGRSIWVRDTARAVTDSEGRVNYYEGTLEDITAEVRRRSHDAALASCSRALLTESSEAAIRTGLDAVLEAADGTFVFVERNTEDPEQGLCSHLVFEVNSLGVSPDYDHWGMVPWTRMPAAFSHLSQGEPYAFRVDDLRGEERGLYEGSQTESELNVPIFIGDEWAGTIGLAAVDADRTWTDDEVGLLRTVAEMIGSFWEREFQRERLEQLVRAKDEFVASVSHELRTPLTAVLGFAMELQDRRGGPARTEEDELIDLIAREADDLSSLVQDLLVAARAEIDTVTCVPGVVDLRAEVEAVLERFWPVLETVEVVGAGIAWADAARLRQIVRNLFSNALRYGGSRIEVHLTEGDDHAFLQVRDNGPAIPDHDQRRLFDPYYRGEQGVTQPVSVGLGLYVSRHLANLMGGDLVYRYQDDCSVFELSLPRELRVEFPDDEVHPGLVNAAPEPQLR
jgi:PAS domain S-box-containing protein